MRMISRRGFIASSGAVLGTLPFIGSVEGLAQATNPVFRHGVASGDPLTDRVILWTRITPKSSTGAHSVSWELARDEKFARIVSRGELETGASRDFTVKVDAMGLDPGTTYYYRFQSAGARSAVGRTRTLPASGVSRIRLGVVSCSNLPQGFFNAYGCLARRSDLDAILHLGDYIYEYANKQYGDGTAIGRIPAPDKEAIALQDYRERHAQYKLDPDSQEVHRTHPFIVTWDDHEFANNAWWGGAQNHNPENGEGDWTVRRAAAVQSYYEWMPIREDAQTLTPRIYRTFRFGDLATLFMLDTRLVGRDREVDRKDLAALASPNRSLLGAAQENWLAGEFKESVRHRATWNVLGQQVMFAQQAARGTAIPNADVWDGYQVSQDRMFDMVEKIGVNNLAVLTGDIHSSWAYDLPRRPFDGYDKATGKGSLGVEFAGTSISSPTSLGTGPEGAKQVAAIRASRPHLHYVDGDYRGYFILDMTKQRMQADFYAVATVQERSLKERFEKGFVTESGRNHLVAAPSPA
ncbi:MAG TPA: alkaline phosphatase D family protein [Vicinamibacterales bacterium]